MPKHASRMPRSQIWHVWLTCLIYEIICRDQATTTDPFFPFTTKPTYQPALKFGHELDQTSPILSYQNTGRIQWELTERQRTVAPTYHLQPQPQYCAPCYQTTGRHSQPIRQQLCYKAQWSSLKIHEVYFVRPEGGIFLSLPWSCVTCQPLTCDWDTTKRALPISQPLSSRSTTPNTYNTSLFD